MLGRLLDERVARLGIVGVDELLGRERCAAHLALVAVSLRRMAARALAADVPVSQEVARLLVVELLAHLLDELTLVIELAEEVACKLVVRLARRAAIDVERDAKPLERILDKVVIAVHHFLHRDTLLSGAYGDRHSVFVRASDEDALAALQPEIARIDVGRDIDSRQMTDMYWSVGVGQSGRDGSSLEMFFHVICVKFRAKLRLFTRTAKQSAVFFSPRRTRIRHNRTQMQ